MTLINKIGLLGLIGVVALIIIYVIRPNYQQKTISSTYVWKLSLKKEKEESAGEYDPEFAVISLSDACAYVPCDDSHETRRSF